eukprot:CAMPEP_0201486966 /NCGR_PEP_ID=MMETSP0151_2-20130828/10982_1 /ASSEMBLY_ACC=CAM_ASM_000257 /TAXON_ID=200890 /ORGANISM="Paramoeba atlantica, Strain 621/1 / CCAP 1560/9" /LENGTH=247 /DNA_ID=CAMNT_0047871853 /DNA_START=141 /DNA_END=884 /DNA_ORIENTATION=+
MVRSIVLCLILALVSFSLATKVEEEKETPLVRQQKSFLPANDVQKAEQQKEKILQLIQQQANETSEEEQFCDACITVMGMLEKQGCSLACGLLPFPVGLICRLIVALGDTCEEILSFLSGGLLTPEDVCTDLNFCDRDDGVEEEGGLIADTDSDTSSGHLISETDSDTGSDVSGGNHLVSDSDSDTGRAVSLVCHSKSYCSEQNFGMGVVDDSIVAVFDRENLVMKKCPVGLVCDSATVGCCLSSWE